MVLSPSKVILASLVLLQASASPVGQKEARAAQTCGSPTVPLLRGFTPRGNDHFYTISASEMEIAIAKYTYLSEGDAAQVFPGPGVPDAVPLYRLWNDKANDHFYTISTIERDGAVAYYGYVFEEIAAYVYPSNLCGAVPLYRTANPLINDHFYTANLTERDVAITRDGYVDEGVACYVFPND